jgi:Na+-driven multidrug efflux pump
LVVSLGMGASGAWISMAASATISAIAMSVRFQTGGWVHRRV